MAIIGIDLGTTNSIVSAFIDGEVVYIPNVYGDIITPSAISIDGKDILIGKAAKERMLTHPDKTIVSFKALMGSDDGVTLDHKTYSPEELSGFLLKRLVADAKAYLKEDIEEIIISVPAYFDDRQRSSTKAAGLATGIKVSRLINEPSAASLSHAYEEKIEESLFMAFDFGGGTLDITLVDVFGDMIEVTSIVGDNKLGGNDINQAIAQAFLKEYNLKEFNHLDRKTKELLLKRSELCKVQLDTQEKTTLHFRIEEKDYAFTFDNDDLFLFCKHIFQKIDELIIRLLQDAKKKIGDIDDVVLIGGSTKMPIIHGYLKRLTGKNVKQTVHPDFSVAHGLGLICGIKQRDEKIKDYILMDVCPFTLGINTVEGFSPLIERNTSLPTERSSYFVTSADNQTKINMSIYQGEYIDVSKNELIGNLIVRVQAAPKGESSVKVTFRYDVNGILNVKVESHSLDKVYEKTFVKDSSLSEQEIKVLQSELENIEQKVEAELTYLQAIYDSIISQLITSQPIAVLQEFQKRYETALKSRTYGEKKRGMQLLVDEMKGLLEDDLGLNLWENHDLPLS